MTSNSAGAVIKLPRRAYSRNSEASVSNDGKIPGFVFVSLLFLSSVKSLTINVRIQHKDQNRPTLEVDHCFCKVKNLLSKMRLFITR